MATAKKTAPKKAAPTATTPVEVTGISGWKSKAAGSPTELPSGNVAIIKNPGMQTFVAAGIIPNSLMPMVTAALKKHEAPSELDMDTVLQSPEMLRDMTMFMDEVVIRCFVEPRIYPTPPAGVEPQNDRVYIHELDEMDKTFVFQFAVGGTRDLERFRLESAEGLAALANGSASEG